MLRKTSVPQNTRNLARYKLEYYYYFYYYYYYFSFRREPLWINGTSCYQLEVFLSLNCVSKHIFIKKV